MTDIEVKISQLTTAAAGDLNGSDEIPLNNGATTKKSTIDSIKEKMGVTDHLADDDKHREINDAGTAATEIHEDEPNGAADGGIRLPTGTESIVAAVDGEADVFPTLIGICTRDRSAA